MAPSESFQSAKDRLAVAEMWAASASQMLKSSEAQAKSAEAQAKSAEAQAKSAKAQEEKARGDVLLSQHQVKEAKEYLKNLEEKLQVIDVDSEDDVGDNANRATVSGSALTSTQTKVVVKCFGGNTFTLDIELSDTPLHIMRKIVDKMGIALYCGWPTRFFATDVSGRRLATFDVDLWDITFGCIKAKIEDRIGTLSGGQQLICHCTMRISVEVIEDGVRKMRIELFVEPSDTIKSVKGLVWSKTGINASSRQHISFAGKDLEDGRTLADCMIVPESTLRFFAMHSRWGILPSQKL